MLVKNVNGRSVRVGTRVIPACNVDLKQVGNGEWTAHFTFSAELLPNRLAASYSCGYSALTERWHVDEIVQSLGAVETICTDEELVELVEDVATRGQFSSTHQLVFDRALARV